MSQNNIMLSISSNDSHFSDAPTTMLGDTVQPHFRLGASGYATSPEVYITIIDTTENTGDTNSSQKVEMSYGIRRINLLSHIDNKDMCAEYVPQITETTVIARGEIPSQYRDRIKITCLESGEVFNAVVGGDGTWSTAINITFNGNESRFSIEGYNASDTGRIISRQGLTIAR